MATNTMINAAMANGCLSVSLEDVLDLVVVEAKGAVVNVKLADEEVFRTLAERGRW